MTVRVTKTAPGIRRLPRGAIMSLSAKERFIIGAEMFEAVRAMVLSPLPRDLSRDEQRQRLYQRVYHQVLPTAESILRGRQKSI
jgi:hypothetical protein